MPEQIATLDATSATTPFTLLTPARLRQTQPPASVASRLCGETDSDPEILPIDPLTNRRIPVSDANAGAWRGRDEIAADISRVRGQDVIFPVNFGAPESKP
jgi:hypothetical protein